MNRHCLWLSTTILVILEAAIIQPGIAHAQTSQTSADLQAEEKLEREFTDPLTTLPQVVLRDSYTPANFGTLAATTASISLPNPQRTRESR